MRENGSFEEAAAAAALTGSPTFDGSGAGAAPQSVPGIPVHVERPSLDREMRDVKDAIIRLGSSVQEALLRAIDAVVRHDAEEAAAVVRDDARLNAMRDEVEDLIILTIATQGPVARDLRYLLMLDHVAGELERMGDYAANVSKQARKLAPEPPLKEYVHLPELGRLAADGVGRITRALIDLDPDEARAVAATDDELDRLYHEIVDEVKVLMAADGANVERGLRIVFAAHYLERVGDRMTNIAEDVVFLATGHTEDLNA
ncbi:MAG: phosphate signaling complex protein PhoU [Chloroflexota bacterium]